MNQGNLINPELIVSANSPIGLFILAILICNTAFAICATVLQNNDLFKYSIHMFLGIVLFFGTILLWSPASLYHPAETAKYNLSTNPWVPTISFFLGVLIYTLFQGWKFANILKNGASSIKDL